MRVTFSRAVRRLALATLLVPFVTGCAAGAAGTGRMYPVPGHAASTTVAAPSTRDALERELGHMFDPASHGGLPKGLEDQVEHFVNLYTKKYRSSMETWLSREGKYGDFMRAELRKAGLPEDLVYLSLIESGFVPTAKSPAGAVGLWQFMPGTAKGVGLRIDQWVDERKDVVYSTRAAISHLKDLHKAHNNWALAAAAYNAGSGRIRQAQRAGETKDYFTLAYYGLLPEETKLYVPKMIAIAMMAHHRDRYGFKVEYQEPLKLDSVVVDPKTKLAAVAYAADTTEAAIVELNPHLLKKVTPPDAKYAVRIPAGVNPEVVLGRLNGVPVPTRVGGDVQTRDVEVREGDTLWSLARENGVTVELLQQWNPGVREPLMAGSKLSIQEEVQLASTPISTVASQSTATSRKAPSQESGPTTEPLKTDSVDRASLRTDPSSVPTVTMSLSEPPTASSVLDQLEAAARETEPEKVRPMEGAPDREEVADARSVEGPSTVDGYYVVRPGDTMYGLLKRFGISLAEFKEWNDIAEDRYLYTGERLRVEPPPPVKHVVAPGETMTGIAKQYGVTVSDLVEWNGFDGPRPVRIGETLLLQPPR